MKKALEYLKSADPVMAELIGQVGRYGISYSPPDYATLAKCIVLQQLSGKVASVIYARLEEAAGGERLTPEVLLELPIEELRATGLSQRKVTYLREAAEQCRNRQLDLEALGKLPDEEVTRRLTRLKGIGPWTVHMFLIFALRRPDVLPTGDLGIRAAVEKVFQLDGLPSPEDVERMGKKWRPYASVASWYLWRSLGDGAGL